jgi:hypothetical protein
VTPDEIADSRCDLLGILEQEHVAAALDLAYFTVGQPVGERHKSLPPT